MTNTIQLTKEKVDMKAWLAVAEKIGQLAEAESREADQNARFSPKIAEAIVEGGINKLMRPKEYGGTFIGVRTSQKLLERLQVIVWPLPG